MTIKFNRALLAFGVAAALAMPSAALAHGGNSGSGRGSNDQSQTVAGHGSGGNDANRTERTDLRGTVVSVDPTAQTIVVAVTKANHGRRGRAHVGQTITFDVSGARLDVRDVNGDGIRDLNDTAAGDAVEVRAELSRSGALDLTKPVTAERLKDRSHRRAHPDVQQPGDGPNHG